MNQFKYAALSACFLLVGCSATATKFQIIEPDYKANQDFSAVLLLMPLSTDLIDRTRQEELAGNSEFPKKALSVAERSFFYNYFGATFSETTTAEVLGIDRDFRPDSLTLEYRHLAPSEKISTYMFVPADGQIKYREEMPDYVLFVEDLYFEKTYEEYRTVISRGTSDKFVMKTGLEYLLWDNRAGKIAAYGKLENTLNLMTVPTKDTYIDVLENFAQSIIQKTPLVRRHTSLYTR